MDLFAGELSLWVVWDPKAHFCVKGNLRVDFGRIYQSHNPHMKGRVRPVTHSPQRGPRGGGGLLSRSRCPSLESHSKCEGFFCRAFADMYADLRLTSEEAVVPKPVEHGIFGRFRFGVFDLPYIIDAELLKKRTTA